MAKAKKLPESQQPWVEARRRYRLTHAQVQMARELGLNPKKFGGYANHRQEQWKIPLPDYIEQLYQKRFGRRAPEQTRSLEENFTQQERKKQERKEHKKADAPKPSVAAAAVEQPIYDDEIPF
jgi:hypothetical protein